MKTVSRDCGIRTFNADHPCCCSVESGEVFWVETHDCYCGQITDASVKRSDIDVSVANTATGPIEVKGAEPGDTLCVEILSIDFAPWGFMVIDKKMGVLGDRIQAPETKVIPVKDGYAHFSEKIHLPLTPMVGVCGVAPAPGLDIRCATPGDHGANMDCKMIRPGSKVYLPVAVSGAKLAVGDMHACMGDGELSGTGIEISGKVCIKTTVLHNYEIKRPIVETTEGFYFIASDEVTDTAVQTAVSDAVEFLQKCFEIPFEDAYQLLSIMCDIQICQLVNSRHTVRVFCPKHDERVCIG